MNFSTEPELEEARISISSKPGTTSAPLPENPQSLPHLPGLDGLRGLAVIGAIAFHSGFSWAKGGFLGVSTFFVLSGFLITSLLIREWDSTGTIRLGRFWLRRFRRLLPAAILALALIVLIWSELGSPEQIANLRYDTFAALAYVANWRFYFGGSSYAELFAAPSPLQHFWSLAIEEQFYLLFPPAMIVLLKVGGRQVCVIFMGVAIALSIGLGLLLGGDFDRIYYGTDTRAAELLAGILLALWWSGSRRQTATANTGPIDRKVGIRATDLIGLAALAVMFWSWWALSYFSQVFSHGGLPLYALLTTVIIYTAIQPGLVAGLLSAQPLRWIGLISYGLYLYHWPVFLILDEYRMGLSAVPLFAIKVAITTLIAVASYHLLEMPIRRRRILKRDFPALATALGATVGVAVCAFALTRNPPQSQIPYADVRLDDFSSVIRADSDGPGANTNADTLPVANTGTVMLLGDSGMVDASPALRLVFESAGATRVLEKAYPAVGLSNPLLKWREAYTELITQEQPDLVIMMLGGWDLKYLQAEGVEAYASIAQEAVDILTAQGARLLWLSMLPGGKTPEREVNIVYEQLAKRYPGKVAYADIESSLRAPPGARSPVTTEGAENWPRSYIDADGSTVLLRKPDFWHLCPPGAVRLANAINQAAADLGWSALAAPGWQDVDGSWRNDKRYNDPPDICQKSADLP